MQTRRAIVEELRRRQGAETDTAFAARIGISREMWGKLRRGVRNPGPDTLARITTAYRDLYGPVARLFAPADDADA